MNLDLKESFVPEDIKKSLRSLVLSSRREVDVQVLLKDYREFFGSNLPYKEYGYWNAVDFLKQGFSDCFVFSGPAKNPVLTLIVPECLKSLDKAVKNGFYSKGYPRRTSVSEETKRAQDEKLKLERIKLLEELEPVKQNVMRIITDSVDGVWGSDIKLLYRERYEQELDLDRFGLPKIDSLLFRLKDAQVWWPDSTGDCFVFDQRIRTIFGRPFPPRRSRPDPAAVVPTSPRCSRPDPAAVVPKSPRRSRPDPAAVVPKSPRRSRPNPAAVVPKSPRRSRPDPAAVVPTSPRRSRPDPAAVVPKSPRRFRRHTSPGRPKPARPLQPNLDIHLDVIEEEGDQVDPNVVPQDLVQVQPAEFPEDGVKEHPADFPEYGVQEHPAEFPEYGVQEHPAEFPEYGVQEHPAEFPVYGVQAHPAEFPENGVQEHPAEFPENGVLVHPESDLQLGEFIQPLDIKDLQPGSSVEVIISEVYSPSHFWFILWENYSYALTNVMAEMNQYYQHETHFVYPETITIGWTCAAMYRHFWARAVVVQVLNSQTVKVRYVDYGTVVRMDVRGLRPLRRKWAQLPAQACRARLGFVRPSYNSNRWSVPTIQVFQNLVCQRRLLAHVVEVDVNSRILEVVLINLAGYTYSPNTELIRLRVADRQFESSLWKLESYLFPTFEALESGATLSFAEILMCLSFGLLLDFVREYRDYVPCV